MKKILLGALTLLIASSVNAQTFGVKAGANFANIIKTGDTDFKTEFVTGGHAGLFLDIRLIGGLSLSPELMFSQKGYKTSGTSILGGPNEYSVTSNFVEIPVLAKLKASDRFNLVVGPQISFLVSTTEKFTQGSDSYQNTIREENENLKKNLFGGVAGIGLGISKKLSLEGRYAIDFQKNNEDGTTEVPAYKNQVYQLGVAIKL